MNVLISFNGMESSDALKSYIEDKLARHEELLTPATSISAEFNEFKSTRGVKADFRFDLSVVLPHAVVRVEESGPDMYANVDKSIDVLIRKLNRYLDRRSNWDGITPWSDLEAQEELDNEISQETDMPDTYLNYIPKVNTRKVLDNMSPMHEAEAIERMELLGDSQILFKNSLTNKISMIYKNRRDQYILVEPNDSI